MSQNILNIAGRVLDNAKLHGIAGLRVEAQSGKDKQSAHTDQQGAFTLTFDQSRNPDLFQSQPPDIIFTFKVFAGDTLIKTTQEAVPRDAKGSKFEIDIVLDPPGSAPAPTSPDKAEFVVKGSVNLADGQPLLAGQVRAFDRDLRSEEPLGNSPLGAGGLYEIRYNAGQFKRREKAAADLMVKAFTGDGKLLAASPILFNAPPVAEINLTISAETLPPPALFEKINAALAPLLGGLKAEELDEDATNQDISFLSGETGLERRALARFALAQKLARQSSIAPQFWFALLGGSFFRLAENKSLQEQLTTSLDSLAALDRRSVQKAITRGIRRNEIGAVTPQQVDEWLAAFLRFVASQSVAESPKPTFVKSALADAGITDRSKQEAFARLFNQHKGITPALLDTLENEPSFSKAEADDLRTSFRLAELTDGDFSVVRMVKKRFDVRKPEAIGSLAKISEDQWVRLVKEKHAAREITLPIQINLQSDELKQVKFSDAEVYGKTLARQFREAYPTAAFAGGLERAVNNGGARGLRHAGAMVDFLERNHDFELLQTPVDDYLRNNADATAQAGEDFRFELKAVQRVFKLAPTFEATDRLLADDLHSAQKIYRVGESEFVRRYADSPGFSAERARVTWNRAADTHAAVLTIVTDLKSLVLEGLPLTLQGDNHALANFPNWNNLFQTGDLCECEHCRSVLSPAAYFTDLLMFLRDRKASNPTVTVKDVLFGRRPDLGYIELDCANALTPIPYIDVVCEVLEEVVAAGANDLELTGFTAMPTDAAAAKAAVRAAFSARNINLGADFTVSQVKPSDADRWVAHGDDVTYLLKQKGTPNFFAELLRNSKASADELRAYPQYVNSKAYEKLRAAKYPHALPFDLFAEEVRAGFQKSNLRRWDLMRTLRGAAAPNNPTDGEIAAEYFNISVNPSAAIDEKRLILIADASVGGQQAVWGASGADWLNTVANVATFLQKTGLEYNELLTLLDLKFINPAGDITINHQDASCDTNKQDLRGLNEAKLDRIHRFLRLWRKLKGWKTWELDLVIRHPAIGQNSLDETCLINLMYLVEVRNRLGGKIAVEQVTALFGNLNTASHFTKLYEKREDGLYQKLFLNKRLINPLDPVFAIDAGASDLPAGQTITNHQPVVLSALGIREADLIGFKSLTRASDATNYISDNLTLDNLSFLWRHAWLAKSLRFSAADWQTVLKIVPQTIPAFSSLADARNFLESNHYIKAASLNQTQVDKLLQKIFHQDLSGFASAKSALEFFDKIEQIKATGFTVDNLAWLLKADYTAKAAVKETDAARFLTGLRKDLQTIQAEYDPAKYPFLGRATNEEQLVALLTSLLQKLGRDDASIDFFLATLRGSMVLQTEVRDLPAKFSFPSSITGPPNNIPIRYDSAFIFTGIMTAAQRKVLLTDHSLAAVTNIPAYQNAIEDLFQQSQSAQPGFLSIEIEAPPTGVTLPDNRASLPLHYNAKAQKLSFTGLMTDSEHADLRAIPENPSAVINELFARPRRAVKFFDPVFTASLKILPPAIDFKDMAGKISYDVEQHLLKFNGFMSADERATLDDLVPALPAEAAYHEAVKSLFDQPRNIAPTDRRVWLSDNDLDAALPANNTYAKRLANAARKALIYLSTTLAENLAVQQASDALELTAATTRALMARFQIVPPDTALTLFTGGFAASTGAASDAAPFDKVFDAWYWLNRVAQILKQWKIDFADLDHLINLQAATAGIDFLSLPLNESDQAAPIDQFLRTHRLLRLRDTLPESRITLFEVLEKLHAGAYSGPADFGGDVELLNPSWLAAEVEALVNALDLTYPADYFLAESWERLRRAFYFLESLNGRADTVKAFAAPAMNEPHAARLKELLRSKFGEETWLALSAEIQDALRERKRDALAAWLLTQPMPADAPSGKWEKPNDLYAYYLLDVEMCSCLLTSRLVQASGSVQLFVQRCFMGLEPSVEVKADGPDGDSAWRWWTWMRKYRVWEANRKVFLWPENYIEPELRKDRSPFFKDLENELLQNEINQQNVETRFANYLEKLDGVAQLEIAGFFQEDDGDNSIVHTFGRTVGAEPHLYYYRRYDYRQWTPWEKVDLDIQGDYLIPAVVNQRLFLFWPVFTEVPDEAANTSDVPIPSPGDTTAPIKKTFKKLQLQMAVSDYRQGKWTPKRISKDFDQSASYDVEIVKKHYEFYPIDRSKVDGRFGICYYGHSVGVAGEYIYPTYLSGAFEIAGCNGVPVKTNLSGAYTHALRPEADAAGWETVMLKWVELDAHNQLAYPDNDFTIESPFSKLPGQSHLTPVLTHTPGSFKMTPPWHLSYMDRFWTDGLLALAAKAAEPGCPVGSWLPFFYNENKRTFFVLPALTMKTVRSYYPDIKKNFRFFDEYFEGLVKTWFDKFDLGSVPRDVMELYLSQAFPYQSQPPYTDDQMRSLMTRFFMREYHFYLGFLSLTLFAFRQFHFKNFYHPFVCDFANLVYNPLQGIPALMGRETQLKNTGFDFAQTFQPTTWVIANVSSKFSTSDIQNLPSLAARLKSPDTKVSAFVKSQLSTQTLAELAAYTQGSDPSHLLTTLMLELNVIIHGKASIFEASRFAGVPLRPETRILMAQNPDGNALARLNRLLLEDAYPSELRRYQSSYPAEEVDFTPDGAYSSYNWELFFHIPLLIANSLSKNQRFEEARDWYHFIFNPLGVASPAAGGSPMSKYWITRPFFEATNAQYIDQRIDSLLRMLAADQSDPGQPLKELEKQVIDWRTNPFDPHRIANYRTVAYQKTVVMKYLDNLIAWGDTLFRQDSMESINEATQLYLLAAEILGPRPKRMPPQARPSRQSFNEMEDDFDKFSNALVEVENLVPPMPGHAPNGDAAPLPMLYFCIPINDQMLGYWDTVADRLYKLRHCLNIEGVARQLALFEPPIDPAALVKAVAGGVDIGSALADLSAPLPAYRFHVLLQKANEVCNDVKALGGALMAALEKKDAEAMARLRQGHEIRVLEDVKAVREKQIEEAKQQLSGLRKNKELVTIRRDFYQNIDRVNEGERLQQVKLEQAYYAQIISQGISILASVAHAIPSFDVGVAGVGGTPKAGTTFGGPNVGNALQAAAGGVTAWANVETYIASKAAINAGHERRWDDWKLQESLANKELEQIEQSIAAAELRIAIAERELENHMRQIENSKATDEFMRSKYTNEELYGWQVGQISGVYFQSYKLAYDLAKRAERCLRFELGIQDNRFINFGYWDSLKKGLLAGEKLQYDLRRLETAYIEQNRREFELTKHVSLMLLDPLALVKLRETGRCFFTLPEELFDLDFPGHYFRRIKSVSLTIPCVVGPYTTISCTARLLKNSIRTNTASGVNDYARNTDDRGLPADDDRFVENNIPVKAMAASSSQNDSGVFELSFRDERYLPFEGAGVISDWSLELFNDSSPDFGRALRQFDYATISDIVLHVKYTAREDAGQFKNRAIANLQDYFSHEGATHAMRLFNLRQEFPAEWQRFLNPTKPDDGNIFELKMSSDLFQFRDGRKTLQVNSVWLLARCTEGGSYSAVLNDTHTFTLAKSDQFGGLHVGRQDVGIEITSAPVNWRLKVTRPGGEDLQKDSANKVVEVQDVLLVLGYASS